MVLGDDREGKHADGKTILICIAIRRSVAATSTERRRRVPHSGELQPPEGPVPTRSCLRISSGSRLLARASPLSRNDAGLSGTAHGRPRRERNVPRPVPEELVGKDFAEVSGLFARRRDDTSCLLIGIQRGGEMMLNPIGGEAGPLKSDDQLILLSRVFPHPTQQLPTVCDR